MKFDVKKGASFLGSLSIVGVKNPQKR